MSRQSKYSCVTSVAQTLQEDPSCQLCSVLARYIQQTPLEQLETELKARFLPDTTTLKQVRLESGERRTVDGGLGRYGWGG